MQLVSLPLLLLHTWGMNVLWLSRLPG